MSDISTLLPRLKSEYLDHRGIGIRRFSEMTSIRRKRLIALLSGVTTATVIEVEQIDKAITKIEEKHRPSSE